jgi:hypothetical protein
MPYVVMLYLAGNICRVPYIDPVKMLGQGFIMEHLRRRRRAAWAT